MSTCLRSTGQTRCGSEAQLLAPPPTGCGRWDGITFDIQLEVGDRANHLTLVGTILRLDVEGDTVPKRPLVIGQLELVPRTVPEVQLSVIVTVQAPAEKDVSVVPLNRNKDRRRSTKAAVPVPGVKLIHTLGIVQNFRHGCVCACVCVGKFSVSASEEMVYTLK